MPNTAIFVGILLIIIGFVGYINGMMTDKASITALIPTAFGVLIALTGLVARAKESSRKTMMHIAAGVALLGFLAVGGRMLSKFSELSMSPAVISQALTAIVCLIFVIMAVRSFVNARRAGNV